MKPEVTYRDGDLSVDLDRLLDNLDVEGRRRLLRGVVWDDNFLRWLVEFVVDGVTEEGDWPGPELSLALRSAFLKRGDEPLRRAVAELSVALAHQDGMVNFYRNQAIRLEMAWPYSELPRREDGTVARPPDREGFPFGPHVNSDDELLLADDVVRLVTRCELCGRESNGTQYRIISGRHRSARCCPECWAAVKTE